MLDACVSAPKGAPETYVPPAWAIEAAASAPRISPADISPLIAIFRAAPLAVAA
jgi:hypothetical protein